MNILDNNDERGIEFFSPQDKRKAISNSKRKKLKEKVTNRGEANKMCMNFIFHSGESGHLWVMEKSIRHLFLAYKYLLSPREQRQG